MRQRPKLYTFHNNTHTHSTRHITHISYSPAAHVTYRFQRMARTSMPRTPHIVDDEYTANQRNQYVYRAYNTCALHTARTSNTAYKAHTTHLQYSQRIQKQTRPTTSAIYQYLTLTYREYRPKITYRCIHRRQQRYTVTHKYQE